MDERTNGRFPVKLPAVLALTAMTAVALDDPIAYRAQWSNGLPADTSFFPIAVWLQSPSNATAYQAAGVNLYIGLWQGPTQSQIDGLSAAGMKVICDQNSFALNNLGTCGDVIVGWMHGDEPDNAQWNGSSYDPCIDPSVIVDDYNTWAVADPTRPVYLNLGQGVSYTTWIGRGDCTGRTDMYPDYIQGCDIVSYDIYPVNSSYAEVEGNLWYVAKGVDSLRMWSGDQKPVWCWIECTAIDTLPVPTPYQVKAEVWMALVHGARGFGYFCHSWYPGFREAAWLADSAMAAAISAVNQRIHALAPVLNGSGEVTVGVVSSNAAVPVDVLAREHGGFTYVFAVAMRDGNTNATFQLPAVSGTAAVEVLDEGRSLEAVDGEFGDTFAGYGVHLYKVDASAAASRPVAALVPPALSGWTSAVFSTDGRMLTPLTAGRNILGLAPGVYVKGSARQYRHIAVVKQRSSGDGG
jgi:hypothetical protein